jgi:hypothetical protein
VIHRVQVVANCRAGSADAVRRAMREAHTEAAFNGGVDARRDETTEISVVEGA